MKIVFLDIDGVLNSQAYDRVRGLYDGVIDEANFTDVLAHTTGHRATVWIPFPCDATSWISDKIRRASKEFVDELHGYGCEVGIWLLHRDEEFAAARAYGADIIETDGAIKPR